MKDDKHMTLPVYMQPVAVHRIHSERLILTDGDARCYLWVGEEGTGPIEIPQALARYLVCRTEMTLLEVPQRMWFVLDDLPVRERAGTNPDIAEHNYPL
ncbi:MAG TPA: hypothetical protein VD789_03275 [Thermomicrobiales bacterium]|nr:hypothetical protein [Thermomicrobiales bacterium]